MQPIDAITIARMRSMLRLERMDTLCTLSRFVRSRGNGFAFSYPPHASHMPKGIR